MGGVNQQIAPEQLPPGLLCSNSRVGLCLGEPGIKCISSLLRSFWTAFVAGGSLSGCGVAAGSFYAGETGSAEGPGCGQGDWEVTWCL